MFTGGNVTVLVRDLGQAVHFYTTVLGLKLQYIVDEHWAQVEAPGFTIGLHGGKGDHHRGASCEAVSIGLEVEDIARSVEQLEERGITFSPIQQGKAVDLAYFRDPDGNVLYLHSQYRQEDSAV